jgi:hypothetical protein
VSICSVNDWKKLAIPDAKEGAGDWLRFERPSSLQRVVAEEREQESRRRSAYREYVELVENEQRRVPPKFKVSPLSYEDWAKHIPADVIDISLASQIATNAALLSKTRTEEAAQAETERNQAREACRQGQPDTNHWKIPAGAAGLKMTIEQATAFARQQGKQFVEHNPEYFPSAANVAAVTKYLTAQNVTIPTEECLKLAWLRLRELGMIEERPAPLLEPAPESQEPQPDSEELREQKRNEYRTKVVVTDPRTGQDYTEYQLDRLPADEYKRLMIGEFRTPRITDVIKPAWYRQ